MGTQPLTGGSEPSLRTAFLVVWLSLSLAVALGAFGAHAFENILSPERLETFLTANRYHFYASLSLLLILVLRKAEAIGRDTSKGLNIAQALLGWGTVLFCSSLYLLSVRAEIGLEAATWLGIITPFGGLAFIFGYAYAGYVMWRYA